MIKQFFPVSVNYKNPDQFLDDFIHDLEPFEIFDYRVSKFLDTLSKKILRSSDARNYPELIAFGYWIRSSNLKKMKASVRFSDNLFVVPRGIAFHIAPNNVDIMFLYSWVLTAITGNHSIVRISQNISPLLDLIFSIMCDAVMESEIVVRRSNRIITYAHDEKINKLFSMEADLRVIWGGDQTISLFKLLPTPPHSKDICFADKFSYTIIKSEEFLKLGDKEKELLGAEFYNDAYLFNQMACSSPQVIIFYGNKEDNKNAKMKFNMQLNQAVLKKRYRKEPYTNVDHLTNWFIHAAKNRQESKFNIHTDSATFLTSTLDQITHEYKSCGGGFFLESEISELDDLRNFGSKKEQTVTYFGLTEFEINYFLRQKSLKTPARIVPIGQALNFEVIWDGYDLIQEFIKFIRII